MSLNRAYSIFEVKKADDASRTITGIATTPETDAMGDVVVSEGAQFKLPIPLLFHHDSRQPIGHVTEAKVAKDGIEVKARFVKIDEPGNLKNRLDEAWQSVKSGLIKGLSIGFKPIEFERIEGDTFGLRFTAWRWIELSIVSIPANEEATITAIKAADIRHREPTIPELRIDPRLFERSWSTARHEAGHLVAGLVMGRNVKRAEVGILAGGGGGQVSYFDGKPKVRAISAMAGSIAEDGTLDSMSEKDRDNVMLALRKCNGDLAQLVKECEASARRIVKEYKPAIDEIARKLRDTGVVYGWDAATVIAKYRKHYPASAIVKPRRKGAVYIDEMPKPAIKPVRVVKFR